MLTVNHVSKRFGDVEVLQDASLIVNAGERVGLVGPNGCGKTTLMRIITGEEAPSGGSVALSHPGLRIGYLPQGLEPEPGASIRDALFPQAQALARLEAELEALSAQLADAPDDSAVFEAYSTVLERIEQFGAAEQQGPTEPILAGLGLAGLDLDDPASILSGGQKTRLGLARILLGGPQLLLLDEPTNHLDIDALEWLEDWLAGFPGAVLIVSHDRTFLDRTVNAVVAIDPVTQATARYPGSYTDYVEALIKAREKQWGQYRDQQVEIARMQQDVRRTMARAVRKENATKNDVQRRYAKKVAKRAKAKETRLNRYLESEERVEKPGQSWQMKLEFANVPAGGQDVLLLEELAVGYDAAAPLLAGIDLILRAGERIALLGPNGCGKTTLLRTITGEIPALDGRARFGANIRAGYLAQEQETLDPDADALETILEAAAISETEARSFLHYFLFGGDDVFVPVSELSYGERARLMLAQMVAQGCNLLILDEPVNHLDVPSRERFEQAMTAYEGTVLAVVHDRYFVDRFATSIWVAEAGKINRYIDRQEYRKVRANGDT